MNKLLNLLNASLKILTKEISEKHIDIYLCDEYNTYRQLSMGGE